MTPTTWNKKVVTYFLCIWSLTDLFAFFYFIIFLRFSFFRLFIIHNSLVFCSSITGISSFNFWASNCPVRSNVATYLLINLAKITNNLCNWTNSLILLFAVQKNTQPPIVACAWKRTKFSSFISFFFLEIFRNAGDDLTFRHALISNWLAVLVNKSHTALEAIFDHVKRIKRIGESEYLEDKSKLSETFVMLSD